MSGRNWYLLSEILRWVIFKLYLQCIGLNVNQNFPMVIIICNSILFSINFFMCEVKKMENATYFSFIAQRDKNIFSHTFCIYEKAPPLVITINQLRQLLAWALFNWAKSSNYYIPDITKVNGNNDSVVHSIYTH